MSFQEIASPFITLGIKVFPLQAGKKDPIKGIQFLDEATCDPAKVAEWNNENPNYNAAILADGNYCFLEFDVKGGMSKAAKEMGQPDVPETRIQKSGGGYGHFIFKHSARSRTIGNRSRNLDEPCTCDKIEKSNKPCNCKVGGFHHHHEWFSFRANNKYLVGAGSLHPNGNYYKAYNDIEPITIPEWVCDFIDKYTVGKPTNTGSGNLCDDFDFDDLMDFYGIGYYMDGDWAITDECPVSGRKHTHSKRTGFFYDGETLGWKCFAQGCPGSEMKIGQVIKYLNDEKGESYPHQIWQEDDDFSKWEIDLVDDEDVIENLEELINKPTLQSLDPLRNMSEERKKELAEASAKAKEHTAKMRALEVEQESESEETEEYEPDESAKPEIDPTLKVVARSITDKITSGLICKTASDYVMTELEWLWPQRIPKGKITLYTGKPDCGKSLAMLDLIARVTTGADFPDGEKNTLGASEVMIAATEDDPADTLIPRLVAAGADISKVKIVVGVFNIPLDSKGKVKGKGKKKNLNLKRDAKLLLEALKISPNIKLLALDPITGFFGDADSNKDSDIRPLMEELSGLLAKSCVTCVGIIHSNKRSDVDAVHKVSGAGSLAAVARATWGFSRDAEDKSLYHMAFVKGNLGKVKSGINYTIEETFVDIGGKSVGSPRINWGDKIEEDADDLLKAERNNKEVKDTKQVKAITLIKALMPIKSVDLYDKAEAEGISVETIKRAKYKIPGLITKPWGGEWWYYMPGNEPWKEEPTMEDKLPDSKLKVEYPNLRE